MMTRVIHIVVGILFCLHGEGYSHEAKHVKGILLDAVSGDRIPYVQILNEKDLVLAISDSAGKFTLSVPTFPVSLSFRLDGYEGQTFLLDAPIDTMLRISLRPRLFTMGEIVVTSARLSQTLSSSPSSIRILSKEEIRRTNATSLADLLSPVEGLFVKNYGAGSGAKTISQRGMGAEHTLFLLNGMRISNTQNGLVDLSLLPVDEIDRVEVIRGGHSASFGADAVAGVINIVPGPIPAQNTVRAASTVGSFGYRRYQLSGGFISGQLGIRLHYGQEQSDEDFPFRFHNGNNVTELQRANSDLDARFGNINASLTLDDETELHAFASVYRSERGVGGPVVGLSSTSNARQNDEDDVLQIGLGSDLSKTAHLTTNIQIRYAYQRYNDPGLVVANVPLNTYFKNLEMRIEPKIEVQLSADSRLATGFDLAHVKAEGNSMKSNRQRTQFGAYMLGDHHLRSIAARFADIVLFPAVRYDVVGSDVSAVSPQFGLLVSFRESDAGVLKRLKSALRASIARSFRSPTLNELFFNGGGGIGNPNLQPERSTSLDAGVSLSYGLFGDHQIQGTYFRNDMTDRIVWVAAGTGAVTPKNLRSVRAEGFEASYRWSLPDNLVRLEANYTSAESRKKSADYPGDPNINAQLIYIPLEMVNLSLSVEKTFDNSLLDQLGGTFAHSFVGYRYYTEDNTGFLPSYWVANMNIRARLSFRPITAFIKCEISNLFNEDYQVIIGYPMPQRSFRLTVGVEY